MKRDKISYTEPARLDCSVSLIARLHDILETGQYTSNKFTALFEKSFREHFNLRGECIAVNGCQNGLFLTLVALGIHRPLIPDFTFSATAHAAYFACRDFKTADCDPKTFNLDSRGRPECDAIVATHVFGCACDCEALQEQADELDVPLIYDAAHGVGSSFKGISIGDMGDASIFSLSPTKNLTSCEGGMIVTSNKCLADKLKRLRNYGQDADWDVKSPGLNARLSEIHSVFGLESLSNLDGNLSKRQLLVDEYQSLLPPEILQSTCPDSKHSYKDFAILCGSKRDKIANALTQDNIEFRRYFRPISSLSCYEGWQTKQPNAKRVYDSILQLPLHTNLELEDIRRICKVVLSELNGSAFNGSDIAAHSPHVTLSRPEVSEGVKGNHHS